MIDQIRASTNPADMSGSPFDSHRECESSNDNLCDSTIQTRLCCGIRRNSLLARRWIAAGSIILVCGFALAVASAADSPGAKGKPTKAKDATKSAKSADDASSDEKSAEKVAKAAAAKAARLPEVFLTGYAGEKVELVNFINKEIRNGWLENDVQPSDPADDAEFCRRIHLDIIGRIPDLETVSAFIADRAKDKRAKLIDKLLEDPGFVRNMTTIWTNLLIGRVTPDDVSRPALQKFLRDSFRKNRPWSEIAFDLVSAEGRSDENGATNFLLSHLNDGAVPATAITARLFLGIQVQCTQCHNHPFNDWKQNQFWEFNSFFKQADKREVREFNPATGQNELKYAVLEMKEFSGPVFYETRSAEMKVAYPKYNNAIVGEEASVNRRLELAKLLTAGDRPQLADAMVNRMWGQLFGFGFTRPVDDMGPHKAPSHPALLERLSAEFVKSNYDLRELIRWICNSEAYNLTSRFNAKNKMDNPALGETPLFSHMYLKSMTAEQLYDSLIVATNAHKSGRGNWDDAEAQRQMWLQQFVVTFGTDENDESTSFDGTIPQALMMMNGELVSNALAGGKGTLLGDALTSSGDEEQAIRQLYLATLSRHPRPKELNSARRRVAQSSNKGEAFQDLYWALLNSNEFIFNH